jgi:hypothetical protein
MVSPLRLTFGEVRLIEQAGAEPWRVLAVFPLGRPEPPAD